jgi:hypothetical protein
LLLPVLTRARGQAQRARCLSNLRQIGIANQQYVTDFSAYPMFWDFSVHSFTLQNLPATWADYLVPYMGEGWNGAVYKCPGFPFATNHVTGPTLFSSYDQNFAGNLADGYTGIGGDVDDYGRRPTRETEILSPSDMVAYGDSMLYSNMPTGTGYGYLFFELYESYIPSSIRANARALEARRHNGTFDLVFRDGHSEFGPGPRVFHRDNANLSRWDKYNRAQVLNLLPVEP